MIKKIIILIFPVVLFWFNETIKAQGFNSISTSDGINIIAVGNSGKYYRSVNGGLSYSAYNNGSLNMNCVASYNNDVWIACNNGIVSKTLKTYYAINSYSTGSSGNLYSVTSPNGIQVYVCGENGTVYKSNDGGYAWSVSNSGISSVKLNSIHFKDANNGTVVGNNGSIYITTDGGANWSPQTSGTTNNLLRVKYFNDTLTASGEYGTLLMKTSGSWTSIPTRIKTDIRGITGINSNNIHICGGGGFIRNNKNGNSKFSNFESNPMMANLVDILYYDANKAWAVSSLNSVIIYTTNGGANWSMPSGSIVSYTWVTKLIASSGIGNNLCEHPYDRNSMFVVYGSTVFVSRNRCETWTNIASIPGGGSAHSFYVSPVDTNIWMVAIEGSPDKVKRSTNYGASWTDILSLNFSNYGQPLEMDQNNPSTYYFAPDGGGFYRSTNNGSSFTEISGFYSFQSPCDIIVTWDSSQVIYLGDGVTGSGLGKIYKSTNGGFNWMLVHTNSSSSEVPSMCNTVFDRNIAYATNWGGGQFYKTTNHGTNWFLLSTQTSSGWGSDICHEDPTLILKGTYGSPTWLSTNSGANLVSTTIGNGSGAGIIVPERGYLIAMQGSGLSKLSISFADSVINQSPKFLNEDFSNSFPPADWDFDLNGSTNNFWIYSPVSSYGSGTGCAEFYTFDAPFGTIQSFITPLLYSTVAGDSLTFDEAYAPYTSGVDSLVIETSTNSGSSFSILAKMYGVTGATGTLALNTAPTTSLEFIPTSSQWATKNFALPAGTNKIRFRARSGSGNNIYLDKIKIGKYTQLNLKIGIEGLYNGWTSNIRDTATIYLRNTTSPFAKIDSALTVIDSVSLNAASIFKNAPSGNYYIEVVHRNGLETWSKSGGETITNGVVLNYDFTSAPTQAYGNNTKLVGSKWCIYSGDVGGDGTIDVSDIIDIYNDATIINTGYLRTDLNGDEIVDVTDLLIAYNNSVNIITKITPETSPNDLLRLRDRAKQMLSDYALKTK